MAEWLKAHAWKACIWQHIEGSNPFLSAFFIDNNQFTFFTPNFTRINVDLGFFVYKNSFGNVGNTKLKVVFSRYFHFEKMSR